MSLECKVDIFLDETGTTCSKSRQANVPAQDAKVDLDLDLTALTPMQRGLYKKIGGALNSLIPEKQSKHLWDLRQNVSGQKEGSMKDQQLHVLELLEQQLGR